MRAERFVSFREANTSLGRLAADIVADLLWHLDSAAGPGGSEVDQDSEYAEFREWFQKVAGRTTLAGMLRLLAGIDINPDGAVSIQKQTDTPKPSFDRPAARMEYLCAEIPDLVSHYGQLFDDEVLQCEADIAAAVEIDMGDPEQRSEGLRLLGVLEDWFSKAQQGMRLFRNDADTLAAFDAYMDTLKEADRARKREEKVAEGEVGTPEERDRAIQNLLARKSATETTICEHQDALVQERRILESVLTSLSRLGFDDSAGPELSVAGVADQI